MRFRAIPEPLHYFAIEAGPVQQTAGQRRTTAACAGSFRTGGVGLGYLHGQGGVVRSALFRSLALRAMSATCWRPADYNRNRRESMGSLRVCSQTIYSVDRG